LQLTLAATRQKQNRWRCLFRLWTLDSGLWTSIYHGMTDKFHAQLRHAPGIPVFFKRENAQEQIVIRREQIRPARPRRPDLRRDELDDFRIPRRGRRSIFADVLFDGVAEAQIEPAVIHADDGVRFALNRQFQQLMEQPPELEIIYQHIGHANDRVLCHVKSQFDPGRRHARSARAIELRDAPVFASLRRGKQRGNQFRREQIPARLTGDEHEGFWFHKPVLTQRRKDAKTQSGFI